MKSLKDAELFVFDLDGTVYVGDKEIDGSFDAIEALRKMGKRVCFFTNNSSRTHEDYVKKLNGMGLAASPDEIYTSGQVTCEYIAENFSGAKVFLLGNEKLKSEFEENGVTLNERAPDVCVAAFDTSLTYDKLYRFCGFVNAGLPYIATHPDNNCPAQGCPMPDVGAIIEAIRLTVGRLPDAIMGKPYRTAGERLKKRYALPPDKIAMVGDRLYTDVAFGNNMGFASVLVLSGETTEEMLKISDIRPDFTFETVKKMVKSL